MSTGPDRPSRVGPPLLLALGLLQMAGDLSGIDALKGLGAAWGASPAPRVFSEVRGLETYSTRFFVAWSDADGGENRVELTPELYGRLDGPYNRRNVYGAALAYGPVLADDPRTAPLHAAVVRAALCDGAPLLRELGIELPEGARGLRVRYEPIAGSGMGDLPDELEAPCR